MHYTSKEVYKQISKQTNDPIVERKVCAISGTEFPIYQSDLDFYDKISPIFNGVKYKIPTPKLCPEERQRKRLMFRNEIKLYRRRCDASGKSIISMYSPDKPFKVYQQSFWWGDQRDALEYGFDFDFTQSFTHQFARLQQSVPKLSINNKESENSEYCNAATNNRDCYMSYSIKDSQNILYSNRITRCQKSIDCSSLTDSQLSYQAVDSHNDYSMLYTYHTSDCSHCFYVHNCTSCSYCAFSCNILNEKYNILNIVYSEEEYKKTIKNILNNNDLLTEYKEQYNILLTKYPKQSWNTIGSEEVFGNNIYYSKNVIFGNEIDHMEGGKYLHGVKGSCNNAYDSDFLGGGLEFVYEVQSVGINGMNTFFSNFCRTCTEIYYSDSCYGCTNCFACVGLRNKSYCIFNKQYTKEEYEKKVSDIISHMIITGEWGEFFHTSLSPFSYNETIAQEHFPITREEAFARGYKRQDNNYDPMIPEGAKVVDWKVTKNEPQDDEQILKAIFVCEISGRPYRIIKQELEFYRKHNLPLPRKHPNTRHEERMKLKPGRTLHLRICNKCNKEMLSVYSAEYDGKVYCEECYNKEIYR